MKKRRILILSIVLLASQMLSIGGAYAASGDSISVRKGELHITLQPIAMGSSVPVGATRVAVLGLTLAASCDADVRIESINVRHTGLGNMRDIAGVMLGDEMRRLSRSSTFDHGGKATLRPLGGLMIKRCSFVDVLVRVNLSSTAATGSEHAVTIDSSSDIVSSAKKVTLLASPDVVEVKVTPSNAGGLSINMLPVPGRPRYGRVDTVARLQIQADSTFDHHLRIITLTNQENARDYQLMNLFLQTRDGKQVSRLVNHMQAKQVTLTMDPPVIIKNGETVILELKAEIRATAGTQIQFAIDDPADIVATSSRPR